MTAKLDYKTLEAAATWYVQLHSTHPTDAIYKDWQAWVNESPDNAQAWTRVEKLQQQLGDLPKDVALPTLAGVRAQRRAVIKIMGFLLVVGTTGWGLSGLAPTDVWFAQQRTAKGQYRQIILDDGSQLDLNTDSAVDIAYSDSLRQIYLRQGEILINTAPDSTGRPFVIQTHEGNVLALGTRFTVRSNDGRSEVQVMDHAVEIRSLRYPAIVQRLEAGQQAFFDQNQIGQVNSLTAGAGSWVQGMLTVVECRLSDFLAELSRYRTGYLRCDDSIANLRLSGAFRLDNTDTILENLTASLPVRIRYVTRYWVSVEPTE